MRKYYILLEDCALAKCHLCGVENDFVRPCSSDHEPHCMDCHIKQEQEGLEIAH
jgi:hypothetical protein